MPNLWTGRPKEAWAAYRWGALAALPWGVGVFLFWMSVLGRLPLLFPGALLAGIGVIPVFLALRRKAGVD
ncbi:hypothetical protein GCM10007092_18190 [Thermus composti]|uniref:Uncharacterized protein n=1 Tax=Thermus composti TaxID=532059 RepID=A0ABV6PZB2_9DEIN|nr:hypothetical protein [Thermus composti]GGN04071.1 hypothetical protein GCM10007092_18190 [Thermus composti]